MTKALLAILLLLPLVASNAVAHSGGLDSNGCHAGSQPYHCHRSPSEMAGNRLRCNLGSKSKECPETYQPKTADTQNSTTNYSPPTNTPSSPKVNKSTAVTECFKTVNKNDYASLFGFHITRFLVLSLFTTNLYLDCSSFHSFNHLSPSLSASTKIALVNAKGNSIAM